MLGTTDRNMGFFFSFDALLFLLVSVLLSAYLLAFQPSRPFAFPELEALAQDAVEVCALNLTLVEGCFSASLGAANPRIKFCLNDCEAPAGAPAARVERKLPAIFNFFRLVIWVER